MSKALFETLTGYEPSPGDEDELSGLLGGETAGEGAWSRDNADNFSAILGQIEEDFAADPDGTTEKLANAFGVSDDPEIVRQYLEQARQILDASTESELLGGEGGEEIDYEDEYGPELLGIPDDFSEQYIADHVVERYRKDLPPIDLRPKLRRFEDDNVVGLLGWLVFNGPEALRVPRHWKPPFREKFGEIHGAENFRRHGDNNYVYQLAAGEGGRTRVVLFADFGTGLAHSRFIARQIHLDGFDAAVHLGDVYYTGTCKEYDEYFAEPLMPAIDNGTKFFVIPDNHDGYSGFHAYVDFIRNRPEIEQEGSYFAIETEHVQFIGLDTIWHSHRGRVQDDGVRAWLKDRLEAGRAASRANVLLTGHEPYSYGDDDLTKLYEDIAPLGADLIDLWFWGNTHYCALFGPTDDTPFFGSCIGHGGYPYKRKRKSDGDGSAAPVLWVESGTRYEPTEVRKDRGMNGFCSFEIEPTGDVALRYRDWRGHERCIVKFSKHADGALEVSAPVEDLTPGA